MPEQTQLQHLAATFEAAVRRAPDHLCVVAASRRLTYAQADREAGALAAALIERGVGPGERIAVILPNWPEAVVAAVAAARLGAILVPVNPSSSYHELKYQLRHAEAAVVVAAAAWDDRDFVEWFDELIAEVPEVLYLVAVGGSEDLWYDDRILAYADLVSKGSHHAPVAHVQPDGGQALAILYTSGTTGKPKGVTLSHRAITGSARATGARLGAGPGDRVFLAVPWFTIFGVSVIAGSLEAGATLVLQERFEAAEAVRLLARERCTLCHGVPTMFALLVREPGFNAAALGDLRGGLIAGSPVSETLLARLRPVCDVDIAYGLTETGPTVAMTSRHDPAARRSNTVGRALEGVELRVCGATATTAASGAGELAVRSATLMSGYHRMPAETRRSFTDDGFFLTGDLAVVDADGFVQIVGRSKELIIRGGFSLHPREVEDVLRAHPGIEDLCVVGIPHDVLGEQICACVVPLEGAPVSGDEILDFAREQLADHKVPDLVHFLDALPVTATGKVKRRELAQAVALELSTS